MKVLKRIKKMDKKLPKTKQPTIKIKRFSSMKNPARKKHSY